MVPSSIDAEVIQGLDPWVLRQILLISGMESASVEAALQGLSAQAPDAAQRLWLLLARTVEDRSQAYVARYGDWSIRIGAALFDRARVIRWRGVCAERFFTLMD